MTLAMHLFQHKKIVFMIYLVGTLIEIASDGLTDAGHCQCFHVNDSDSTVDAGEFYKQEKKW